jgi:hypothetical protein
MFPPPETDPTQWVPDQARLCTAPEKAAAASVHETPSVVVVSLLGLVLLVPPQTVPLKTSPFPEVHLFVGPLVIDTLAHVTPASKERHAVVPLFK